MTRTEKYQKIKELIVRAERVLIPFHLNPDGDMVGSGLALAAYCREVGKEVRVLSATPVDPDWEFLPYFELIEDRDPAGLDLAQFDLIIFADCDGLYRVTLQEELLVPETVPTVGLDHHDSNKGECDINIVERAEVCSTAQLVMEFFDAVGASMSPEQVNLLYWGLFTDTGMFEYGKSLARAHRDAARLLEKGAPHHEFVFQLTRQNDYQFLKFIARGLENLRVDEEAGFSWITLSLAELEELGVRERDYHYGITPFIKTLKGTHFGIFMMEEAPSRVRGSLRSRRQQGFDCSKLAEALGGGGHPAAAGFTLKTTLQEAEKRVLEKARKFAREYAGSSE